MTEFMVDLIKDLETDLTHEIANRTETNYNGLGIDTVKRRLETARDALFLYETGELTIKEAEAVAVAELYK